MSASTLEQIAELRRVIARHVIEINRLHEVCNLHWATITDANKRAVRAEVARDDLLAALRKLVSYNEDIRDGRINYRPDDHIMVATAAINKAEGR